MVVHGRKLDDLDLETDVRYCGGVIPGQWVLWLRRIKTFRIRTITFCIED
jgi:hypothetical protein